MREREDFAAMSRMVQELERKSRLHLIPMLDNYMAIYFPAPNLQGDML